MTRHIPRIYCQKLSESFEIEASKVIHLVSVLRLRENEQFIAFNEDEGEWLCSILKIDRHRVFGAMLKCVRKSNRSHKVSLAFCPIKQDNMKLIIEKCTEFGVTDFYPIRSKYTNSSINIKKLKLISIMASEQSERLDIPTFYEEVTISGFVSNLPENTIWISAIERNKGIKSLIEFDFCDKNIGFIIGPEGGFSNKEKDILIEKTSPVTISNNILRSETAAIACLSVYSAMLARY